MTARHRCQSGSETRLRPDGLLLNSEEPEKRQKYIRSLFESHSSLECLWSWILRQLALMHWLHSSPNIFEDDGASFASDNCKKTEYSWSSDYESTLQSTNVSRGVTVSRTINFNVVILLEASLQPNNKYTYVRMVNNSTLIRMVLPEEL